MNAANTSPPHDLGACPSEFGLERLRVGELAGANEGTAMAFHVERCASCSARLAALSLPPPPFPLDAVWREAYPPIGAPSRVPRARGSRSRTTWAVAAAGVATFAAGAAAWMLFAIHRPPVDMVKGGPWGLSVIAKPRDRDTVTRLSSGARLQAGDRLRFEVSTTWSDGYAAVISLDSVGVVSCLAPVDGQTVEVPPGRRLLLEGAAELDASPGVERIDLVGCHAPMPIGSLVAAARAALLRAADDLRKVGPLVPGCHQETFWFEKAAAR